LQIPIPASITAPNPTAGGGLFQIPNHSENFEFFQDLSFRANEILGYFVVESDEMLIIRSIRRKPNMRQITILCGMCGLVGALVGHLLAEGEGPGISQVTAAQSFQDAADGGDQKNVLTAEEQTNIGVYEAANRSVVHINTRSLQIDPFMMMARQLQGAGSGAVLDKKGHIITNYHVVEGARNIDVTLASNTTYPAELVGKDKEHDIAILRVTVPAEQLYPIRLGNSGPLRVGQRVYALGNPFGWDGTLTTGIISSLNRDLPSRVEGLIMNSLIQTDAAMNPGNSGGPLLDTGSRMIGMCVAIATKTGQNAGVGFAIPIDRIKRIVPELIEHGRVIKADIGITHVMETESGLVIARLTPGGPAARSGLRGFRKVIQRRQRGGVIYETESVDRTHADRILAIDGEPMRTGVSFRDKIWEYNPGDKVTLTIVREGRQQDVVIELGKD
jgi:S1-C subfamily serine protease